MKQNSEEQGLERNGLSRFERSVRTPPDNRPLFSNKCTFTKAERCCPCLSRVRVLSLHEFSFASLKTHRTARVESRGQQHLASSGSVKRAAVTLLFVAHAAADRNCLLLLFILYCCLFLFFFFSSTSRRLRVTRLGFQACFSRRQHALLERLEQILAPARTWRTKGSLRVVLW